LTGDFERDDDADDETGCTGSEGFVGAAPGGSSFVVVVVGLSLEIALAICCRKSVCTCVFDGCGAGAGAGAESVTVSVVVVVVVGVEFGSSTALCDTGSTISNGFLARFSVVCGSGGGGGCACCGG